MNLSNLKPAQGSTHSKRRIGRGPGSGMGGTSTRGHKGAKSRSGYHKKFGFEGGQMPLQRRLPKFGFRNPNRVEYKPFNLSDLAMMASESGISEITLDDMINAGRITRNDLVKVLGNGAESLSAKLTVHAHAFSQSAKDSIEKAGGQAVVIERE